MKPLTQWVRGEFSFDTSPTISAGYSVVQMLIDGIVHTVNVWDTAGTPQLRALVPMYCRDSDIAAVVFDLTQKMDI